METTLHSRRAGIPGRRHEHAGRQPAFRMVHTMSSATVRGALGAACALDRRLTSAISSVLIEGISSPYHTFEVSSGLATLAHGSCAHRKWISGSVPSLTLTHAHRDTD